MTVGDLYNFYLNGNLSQEPEIAIEVFDERLDDYAFESEKGEYLMRDLIKYFVNKRDFKNLENTFLTMFNYNPYISFDWGEDYLLELCKYYAFKNDKENLKNFIEYFEIDSDFDLVGFQAFLIAACYGHKDLCNEMINYSFDDISDIKELKINNSELNNRYKLIKRVKYYSEFEDYFYKHAGERFNWKIFRELSSELGIVDHKYFLEILEKVTDDDFTMFEIEMALVNDETKQDAQYGIFAQFMLWMYSRRCPFYVTSILFYHIFNFFLEYNIDDVFDYIYTDILDFAEYLINIYKINLNNLPVFGLFIFGNIYFNEFLKEKKLIDEDQYSVFYKNMQTIKVELFKNFNSNLWTLSFISQWDIPSNDYKDEFENDIKIIQESFNKIEKIDPEEERERIQDELENLEFEDILADNPIQEDQTNKEPKIQTQFSEKIGRNERVDVQYIDGDLIENIKFKKVEKDVRGGKCTIVHVH